MGHLLSQARLRGDLHRLPGEARLEQRLQRLPRAHVRGMEEAHRLVANESAQLEPGERGLGKAPVRQLYLRVGRAREEDLVRVAKGFAMPDEDYSLRPIAPPPAHVAVLRPPGVEPAHQIELQAEDGRWGTPPLTGPAG